MRSTDISNIYCTIDMLRMSSTIIHIDINTEIRLLFCIFIYTFAMLTLYDEKRQRII